MSDCSQHFGSRRTLAPQPGCTCHDSVRISSYVDCQVSTESTPGGAALRCRDATDHEALSRIGRRSSPRMNAVLLQ